MPGCAVGCSERITDRFLDAGPRVGSIESTSVVVKRGSGKLCQLPEHRKRVLRLEVLDCSDFQRRSGDFKASNFPK